ncbi:MAG: HNH endonuclease signature motif containing protein [Cyanobacteria bacterium J06639_1]
MSREPDSLKDIVPQIFQKKIEIDKQINHSLREVEEIQKYYHPRAEFNRWRDSSEGREWKLAQYYRQKGCCSICQNSIEVKGAHIDHIKPISTFPELNLSLSNLRVTCADCNLRKGSS